MTSPTMRTTRVYGVGDSIVDARAFRSLPRGASRRGQLNPGQGQCWTEVETRGLGRHELDRGRAVRARGLGRDRLHRQTVAGAAYFSPAIKDIVLECSSSHLSSRSFMFQNAP